MIIRIPLNEKHDKAQAQKRLAFRNALKNRKLNLNFNATHIKHLSDNDQNMFESTPSQPTLFTPSFANSKEESLIKEFQSGSRDQLSTDSSNEISQESQNLKMHQKYEE